MIFVITSFTLHLPICVTVQLHNTAHLYLQCVICFGKRRHVASKLLAHRFQLDLARSPRSRERSVYLSSWTSCAADWGKNLFEKKGENSLLFFCCYARKQTITGADVHVGSFFKYGIHWNREMHKNKNTYAYVNSHYLDACNQCATSTTESCPAVYFFISSRHRS